MVGAVLDSLSLPPEARLDHRVPKTLLVEHGAPTAADKRQINDRIEEVRWVGALKPTTVGVAEYRDEAREVLEVAVLTLTLRPEAKAARLVELVHRAIPYPLLLVTVPAGAPPRLSVADKRWSHAESQKTVLDGDLIEIGLGDLSDDHRSQLLGSLSLRRQPWSSLYALYRGWMAALTAAESAQISGRFRLAQTTTDAARQREALRACLDLDKRIRSLRSAAARERQTPRLVEMNLELKRLQAERDAAAVVLRGETQ